MRAWIKPLGESKYYGTIIVIPQYGEIPIWFPGDFPSRRQCKAWGISLRETPWDELSDYMSDGHFESDVTYEIASVILRALKEVS